MDSLRVSFAFVADERRLRELLDLLDRTPRLVEEIAFFTSVHHSPMPVDELRRRIPLLQRAMSMARAAGYRSGVNHLATTGHHDENLEQSVDERFRRQVGLDGQTCRGALCPADARVREFVAESYRALAECGPDFIWVDDDVRLGGHMPTAGCCLCEGCIADFSREVGTSFTRESLVAAMDASDQTHRAEIRRLFLRRNARVIGDLLALVERSVHEVSPDIELGFMTGDRFWEGYDFEGWAAALRGKIPRVRWRPGGGFYGDERPKELLDKMHAIGRQSSVLPEFVTINQSEIENFPYQPLRKSARANVLEASAYLMAGCTGTAFNILSQEANPPEEHLPLLERLREFVPFWNALKRLVRGSEPAGAWAAWDPLQIAAGRAGRAKDCFVDLEIDLNSACTLAELGVPICYRQQQGAMHVLGGRMPYALGLERMKQLLLTSGVLLDAEALACVDEMGLSELAGAKVGRSFADDTIETFTQHALNREFSGWKRDCRQSFRFWSSLAHELLPLSRRTQTLARLGDYQQRDRGASFTIFENDRGGRVAAMSYFPWSLHMGMARRQQIVSVCDWLSRDTMSLVICDAVRLTPIVRRHPDGRLVIALFNLSGDAFDSVDLLVRGGGQRVARLTRRGEREELQAVKASAGNVHVRLDPVEPWSHEVLCVGDFT